MAIPDVSILRRCVGALCFVLVCGALAFARPVVQGPTTSPEFADPRTSMTTYQRAITAWKNQRDEAQRSVAKACFDVRHMAAKEADYAAGRVAEDLDFVLDRVVPFDPTKYADRALVGDSTTWTIDLVNDRHPSDVFTLEFTRLSDGRWVFGRSVVERVSDWWSVVQDWPLVAGAGKRMTLSERVRATVPVRFQEIHFWLEDWQWLGLLALMLAGWALKLLVSVVFRHGVDRLGRADGIRVDRALLASFERPLALLITALMVARGLVLLDVEPAAYGILFFAASLVLDVAAVWAAFRLVDVASSFLAERAAQTENKFDDVLVPLLRRTLKIVVAVVGILYLATLITDDVTSLVAGISIGTLALGFAAKDSIENLFGTFTVLLDKPFQLGDVIKVGDVEGTVEDVGFRSTRLRTGEDSLITVPNSRFISANVDNLGARRHRRIRAFLSLTYDTPPAKIEAFCEGVRELIRRNPNARQDNFEVSLYQLSASSVDVLMQFYVLAPGFRDDVAERHAIYSGVLELAQRLNVGLAFPTTTLHVARPEDAVHPDTPRSRDEARERGRAAASDVSKS
ncbi:MAG: mechanosensitive ion channel family protein [Planctomycetes bacterium]|nr:mechanosensitive ion channel family protein [Planctomycetota bacterium]